MTVPKSPRMREPFMPDRSQEDGTLPRRPLATPSTGEKRTVLAVPIEALSTPRDGDVLTNRWWVVRDGRALFYRGQRMRGWAPQCNSDRRLPEQLTERLHPEATVEFVPIAYLGHWNDDRGHVLTPALIAEAAAYGAVDAGASDDTHTGAGHDHS